MEDRATFPPELRSASEARHHAERVLREWELDTVTDAARLLISELVINAVLHAGTESELVLRCHPDRLRVEVTDQSVALPVRRAYSPSSPSGRPNRPVREWRRSRLSGGVQEPRAGCLP